MVRVTPPATPTAQQPTDGVFVLPFTVLVDTREQQPWTFQGFAAGGRTLIVRTSHLMLATGDYSISGHEDRLAIERKSGDDLLGSIGAGHDRFRREHERMHELAKAGGFAAVVIEDSLSRLCESLADPTSGRRITADTLIGVTASWPQRYNVHWLFAGSRRAAEQLALKVMLKFFDRDR